MLSDNGLLVVVDLQHILSSVKQGFHISHPYSSGFLYLVILISCLYLSYFLIVFLVFVNVGDMYCNCCVLKKSPVPKHDYLWPSLVFLSMVKDEYRDADCTVNVNKNVCDAILRGWKCRLFVICYNMRGTSVGRCW